MKKAATQKRINGLERSRRAAADAAKSKETPNKRFQRMRAFTSTMGVSDENLKAAMLGENDMSKVLSKLKIVVPGEGVMRHANAFTGDGLYETPPEPYNMGRYKLGDSKYPESAEKERDDVNDFRIENTPQLFRPVMRKMDGKPKDFGMTVNKRVANERLGDRIRQIQDNQARVVSEPYTFPDTNFDFNMLEAVQTSIASYEKKKNMFKVRSNGDVYTQLANQL
jgi:hypothetical protein